MINIHQDLAPFYKKYQGADPVGAKYLFIGSDANFALDIADKSIFPHVVKYLHNGADFWRESGKHHPFLLTEYGRKAGHKYHDRFQKIGFTENYADEVSFLELLDYPVYESKKINLGDLCPQHLKRLDQAITSGEEKCVFLTYGVASLMRRTRKFPWLSSDEKDVYRSIKLLWEDEKTGTRVFKFYHFSNWGTYRLSDEEIRKIGEIAGVR